MNAFEGLFILRALAGKYYFEDAGMQNFLLNPELLEKDFMYESFIFRELTALIKYRYFGNAELRLFYLTWLGYAFEALCFKHSEKIKSALGIAGLTTHVYGFRNEKVQIDLVIDRSDKSINLCEMKYTHFPFEMSEAEARKIKARKAALFAHLTE